MSKEVDRTPLTTNLVAEVREAVAPLLARLRLLPKLEGIVLLGGLGRRRFVDSYSDVDLALFWPSFEESQCPLPFEFRARTSAGELVFNVHQIHFEQEEAEEGGWDVAKAEAYSNAEVVFDRAGLVSELIAARGNFDRSAARSRLIYIAQQYCWRGRVHSVRACARGAPESGHDLLGECVQLLAEAAYLVQGRFAPHPKWRLLHLQNAPKPFDGLYAGLAEGLLAHEHSAEDVARRLRVLDGVYARLLRLAREVFDDFPADPDDEYRRTVLQPSRYSQVELLARELVGAARPEVEAELVGLLSIHVLVDEEGLRRVLTEGRVRWVSRELGEVLRQRLGSAVLAAGERRE